MPQLNFKNAPDFKPHYGPFEIIISGAFNGKYFDKISSFKGLSDHLARDIRNIHINNWGMGTEDNNRFKVFCEPRRRGNEIPPIYRKENPQWFLWYCKFYDGLSNSKENPYRVEEWKNEVKTLYTCLKRECIKANVPIICPFGEQLIQPKEVRFYRQQLLHYGWESTIDPIIILK